MAASLAPSSLAIPYSEPLAQAIPLIANELATLSLETVQADRQWLAIRLLENDVYVRSLVSPAVLAIVTQQQHAISQVLSEETDILLADARYRFIREVVTQCVVKTTGRISQWTRRIDNIVLHRVLGNPFFLFVMYCMFIFAINIGGVFQDFFDISSNTLFVDGLAHGLRRLGAPDGVIALLAEGVGKGINTHVDFCACHWRLILFLAFLEDSGYMARAAFVVDRLMRAIGLPGKSFVPMIVGFGCNVPAVLATRTLDNKRDRILTIMMSPFMSCGARLAIYAVFTAAFFPCGWSECRVCVVRHWYCDGHVNRIGVA